MEISNEEYVIDLDQELVVSSLKKKTEAFSAGHINERCTISRVPAVLRDGNRHNAYEPKIISMGPFHRNKEQLRDMDELKPHYLLKILNRNPNVELQDYVKLIGDLERKARSSYSEKINLNSNDFVEMMLLDGCFTVELLLMLFEQRSESSHMKKNKDHDDDPILRTAWMLPLIEYDMLMLENQIPLFILDSIFKKATSEIKSTQDEMSPVSLVKLLLYFFDDSLPTDGVADEEPPSNEADPKFYHILHFYHCCISPQDKECQQDDTDHVICDMLAELKRLPSKLCLFSLSCLMKCWRFILRKRETGHSLLNSDPESIPCAVELARAGVKFKVKNTAKTFLDVTFKDGVMEMPTLKVYDEKNSLFRNLLAFEQCFPDAGMHVTAYAVLMDCLIDTVDDVALLHRRGCIMNGLGNDEDVALLFNSLCKDIAVSYDYLGDLFKDVNKHSHSSWNKWRTTLMRDYFSSPWAFLSLIGVLTVIVLTAIQTVFSVLSYYHSSK